MSWSHDLSGGGSGRPKEGYLGLSGGAGGEMGKGGGGDGGYPQACMKGGRRVVSDVFLERKNGFDVAAP